jgi:DNA-binding response OmpR family regulator
MSNAEILIVEDHPTMREAMRLVLEHEGFVIREVADGASALAMARSDPPDLMFLDLNIPGTSGADEYFTKPFSPTALLRTVEQVLGTPQS